VKVTVNTDVEIDLSEIDTDGLIEELEGRGQEDIGAIVSMSDIVDMPLVLSWLRSSNPPKEIRDWFYQVKGRIL